MNTWIGRNANILFCAYFLMNILLNINTIASHVTFNLHRQILLLYFTTTTSIEVKSTLPSIVTPCIVSGISPYASNAEVSLFGWYLICWNISSHSRWAKLSMEVWCIMYNWYLVHRRPIILFMLPLLVVTNLCLAKCQSN